MVVWGHDRVLAVPPYDKNFPDFLTYSAQSRSALYFQA